MTALKCCYSLICFAYLFEFLMSSDPKRKVNFDVNFDSNPQTLAESGCVDEYESCFPLAVAAIELYMANTYGKDLNHWEWNKSCKYEYYVKPHLPFPLSIFVSFNM